MKRPNFPGRKQQRRKTALANKKELLKNYQSGKITTDDKGREITKGKITELSNEIEKLESIV